MVQRLIDRKHSMIEASLAQPDPYAGGEGLMTCCTRSCPRGWSPILISVRLPQAVIYAHATQVNPLSQQKPYVAYGAR